MDNYLDWEHHIPDLSMADDGYGDLVYTPLDAFFFNNDRMFENSH